MEKTTCWWKIPGMTLKFGLKKLETDADLLEMCKDCRRNHNVINIYFQKDSTEIASQPTENPSQPTQKPPADNVTQTTTKRIGRVVKQTLIEGDSKSHESYENGEDSVYKPPKLLVDLSESDSEIEKGNSSMSKKHDKGIF
ncbi:hypothetical protein PIB30_090003 [Stylosanthes scabra]|uniref:PB1-like domain-containing protein n=1 Tax=Stylosanthes scabra TaxID=79078 RepID=A0ABU6ZT01_9FABA|nr:hypothetical protein [Stylosanthes scabra]